MKEHWLRKKRCIINIDDIQSSGEVNSILAMFEKQKELMKTYDMIETENGAIVPKPPYSLDNRQVQYRLKDLFWRVTEELAEATEAVESNGDGALILLPQWKRLWDQNHKVRHYFEELADAIHFLVEASILSGISHDEVWNKVKERRYATVNFLEIHWYIIYQLGLAANCLKNKPWKQTAVPTDMEKFKRYLLNAWSWMAVLWTELYCQLPDILSLYERKWGVNKWRQETQY
jgi:hypothetical protein